MKIINHSSTIDLAKIRKTEDPFVGIARLEVLGHACEYGGHNWHTLLGWVDAADKGHKLAMPNTWLVDGGSKLLERLLFNGLSLMPSNEEMTQIAQWIGDIKRQIVFQFETLNGNGDVVKDKTGALIIYPDGRVSQSSQSKLLSGPMRFFRNSGWF